MIVPGHDPVWAEIFPGQVIPEEARQPASVDLRLGANAIRNPEEQDSPVVPCPCWLYPGEFLLAETLERVRIPAHMAARVEGKSSLGRKGLIIHATAGFIDPGFEGIITLEMANISRIPIPLSVGQWIGQLSLHLLSYPVEPQHLYNGHYQGAVGPERSKV